MIDPSWYLNIGVSDHISPKIRKLNITEKYNGDDKIQVRNGNYLFVSHVSTSFFPNLKFSCVPIVPKLTKHLLSFSKLTQDNNVFMEFWPTHCVVKARVH